MKLSANTVHQKEKHCDDVYVTEYRNSLLTERVYL